MIRHSAKFTIAAVALAAAVALTGCANSTPATQATQVTLNDGWAKAVPSMNGGGMGMSAIFGTLSNIGSKDATLVSASCPKTAATVQLHETYTDANGSMAMRQKDGGFVIPANGTFTLQPGGYHIMLMDMPADEALVAGDSVSCTLTFSDKSSEDITVPVKSSSTYNESTSTPAPTMSMG